MTTVNTATTEGQEALRAWNASRKSSVLGPFLATVRLVMRDRFALVGVILLGIFVVVALLGDFIAPYGPFETMSRPDGKLATLDRPSGEHWLGTTSVGKDVLSQLILGTRVAFIVGISAAVVSTIVSTLLGMLAGYYGGRTDDIVMRITDVVLSIPTLPFAIVAVSILGPSLFNIVLVIALLFWRNGARIVRSAVLAEREKVYVQAARAAGASNRYIMTVHILPNVIPVAFLWMTMSVAFAILAEASLSFLGLGDPNQISWGQMLNAAFVSGEIRSAWWWTLPPSLGLIILVSSIYLIGRAYEEKSNPRLRRN
jgi:peptide/nickel transport system permease protein